MAELTRGAICGVRIGRSAGHEQSGRRYAIIVQSDDLSLLSTVVVVPTSTSARTATFRPEVVVEGQRTRVLCEQIRTVDSQRLGGMIGILTASEMRSVEDALQIILEL